MAGLFVLLDFSIVFDWRGHDIISGLRSPNKKILDMHTCIVRGFIPHTKFQNHRSKIVGPREAASLQLILSGDPT